MHQKSNETSTQSKPPYPRQENWVPGWVVSQFPKGVGWSLWRILAPQAEWLVSLNMKT
jgi:hypothetical protein